MESTPLNQKSELYKAYNHKQIENYKREEKIRIKEEERNQRFKNSYSNVFNQSFEDKFFNKFCNEINSRIKKNKINHYNKIKCRMDSRFEYCESSYYFNDDNCENLVTIKENIEKRLCDMYPEIIITNIKFIVDSSIKGQKSYGYDAGCDDCDCCCNTECASYSTCLWFGFNLPFLCIPECIVSCVKGRMRIITGYLKFEINVDSVKVDILN